MVQTMNSDDDASSQWYCNYSVCLLPSTWGRPRLWEHHSQSWHTVPRAKAKTTTQGCGKDQTVLGRQRGRGSSKAGEEELRCSRWEVMKTWSKDVVEVMVKETQMQKEAQDVSARFWMKTKGLKTAEFLAWDDPWRNSASIMRILSTVRTWRRQMKLQLHQTVEKKIQRWRGLPAKQGKNRKAGLQGQWTTFTYKQ